MPQVRVVLRDEVVEQGERLRQVTEDRKPHRVDWFDV
jgi:hypothetical protein